MEGGRVAPVVKKMLGPFAFIVFINLLLDPCAKKRVFINS